jgi:hypothetical protein
MTAAATPDELLEQASLLHRLYRSVEAGPLWERLLAHPDATPAHWLPAARLWFERRRFDGCARFTARALEVAPDSPDIAAMHASALERAGHSAAAADCAREWLGRHPGHARLVRQLARIERADGLLEQARGRLQECLERHPSPDDWRLRYELAAVLDQQEDAAGAMHELEVAKRSLAPETARHRSVWRWQAARQWELTCELDAARLTRWQQGDPEPCGRICLMAGFPRSGTTLLERLLSRHPGCIGTDESGILATQFRDPIVFGAASVAEVIGELEDYTPDDLAAGRSEYLRCTTDVLGAPPGDRWLIEKDPLLTADLALPLRLFPQARLLMPLRDPRDVVISYFFTIVPLAPNSAAAASLEESCQGLAETLRHWLWLRERIDAGRWMESRYEDLLADPPGQAEALAGFLGLPPDAAMLSGGDHERVERPAGTPSYRDAAGPLHRRSVQRWKRYARWLEPHLHHLEPVLDAFRYR